MALKGLHNPVQVSLGTSLGYIQLFTTLSASRCLLALFPPPGKLHPVSLPGKFLIKLPNSLSLLFQNIPYLHCIQANISPVHSQVCFIPQKAVKLIRTRDSNWLIFTCLSPRLALRPVTSVALQRILHLLLFSSLCNPLLWIWAEPITCSD